MDSVNYDAIQGADHCSGWCEMDSHADTCVVLEYTGRYSEVEAYSPDYPSKQIPITTVATAYDCPTSGAIFILIINSANLSPNQLRDNDVHVDKRHHQHAPDSIFGIHIPSKALKIPFALDGVVAGFDSRLPTQDEFDQVDLKCRIDI